MGAAIFSENKLEELLVANWSHFLDSRELLAHAKRAVQDHAGDLAIINGASAPNRQTKLTISRFCMSWPGFVVWVDISTPAAGGYAEATVEYSLSKTGDLIVRQVAGVIHRG